MNHVLKLATAATLVTGALALSGCATLPSEAVGRVIHRYCDTATDADRAAIRSRISAASAPHEIEVTCDDGRD